MSGGGQPDGARAVEHHQDPHGQEAWKRLLHAAHARKVRVYRTHPADGPTEYFTTRLNGSDANYYRDESELLVFLRTGNELERRRKQ